MSTLTKKPAKPRKTAKRQKVALVTKAVPGNPFAGVEHLFGSHSFPPLKGKAFKKHLRARILADHNT